MGNISFIQEQINRGRWTFTFNDYRRALGINPKDALATLRRYRRIVSPARGFYAIVPEDASLSGRLPAERYIDGLMNYLGVPYYVALLTAASFHGAAHQSPQIFQVMTHLARRNIQVNQNKITFYQHKNIDSIPTDQRKTATGYFRVSTPEATFLDLIEFNRRIGGLDSVLLVTSELAEVFKKEALESIVKRYRTPMVQRGGYLLELLGLTDLASVFAEQIARVAPVYTYLNPSGMRSREPKDNKWKIIVNEEVDTDV